MSLPASIETVSLFIAFLCDKMKYTSIVNYVASVGPYHTQNNYESPDLSHFAINQALSGVKRSKYEVPNQKTPILSSLFRVIYDHLHIVPEDCRIVFWPVCLIGFFTLLRKSNLFFADGQSHLTLADLKFTDQGALFRVRVI